MHAFSPARRHRPTLAAIAIVLAMLTCRAALAADRARLSADLAAYLAAGAPSIDVIVHGSNDEVARLAARYNVSVIKYLSTGGVLRVSAGQLAALQTDGSQDHLSSDIQIRSTGEVVLGDESDIASAVFADIVWDGAGQLQSRSGAGVGIAVIDSGIDLTHQALRNRVAATVDFIGGDGGDQYGHGTHVAALIAGRGLSVSGKDFRGIAYDAHIVNLRVLDADGAGRASSVIEAIDWAIANRDAYNIRVINVSIGAPVLQPYRDDPLCEAAERAVAAGIMVVASAGNRGVAADGTPQFGGITSPGNDPNVITVGALDTRGSSERWDDAVAPFSSKGPTTYDLVAKPDLVAPGMLVASAEAAGALLLRDHPDRHVGGAGADAYMELSGTSMSAAVVSGVLGLLLEQWPPLRPAEAKAILQASCSVIAEGPMAGGAGGVNALSAARLLDQLIP